MTVSTYTQPDYTAQTGSTYKANIDGAFDSGERIFNDFAPHAQSTPDMTVRLDAGHVFDGLTLLAVAAQSSATITAPTSNPRIDRIVVDRLTGTVAVITGTEAASPSAPAITAGKVPVAQARIETTSTTITNAMITDERDLAWLGVSDGTVKAETGTTYTVVLGDKGKVVTHSNGSAIAVTLPVATTAGFIGGFYYRTLNLGAGTVTITPTTSTINGGATLVLKQYQSAMIFSDGTNYQAMTSTDSLTGVLGVASGGTGAATLTDGGILLGSGTGAVTPMAVLADGEIVVGDGTTDPVALAAFTSSTGQLKHERGGTEADLSAVVDGDFIVGTGTGTIGLESGATARSSLGLGSMATQAASAVAVTGGTITGITDLAVADGGTGASTAADAFTALKQAASDSATGVVELATDAETVTGTDTARATTPANITAKMAAPGTIGGTTPGAITVTTLNGMTVGASPGDIYSVKTGSVSKVYGLFGNAAGFVLGNSQSMTLTVGTSAKLISIEDGSGRAGLFFCDFAATTLVELADPSSRYEASGTPSSGAIGLSKGTDSHVVTVTAGSSGNGTIVIKVLSGFASAVTDPA